MNNSTGFWFMTGKGGLFFCNAGISVEIPAFIYIFHLEQTLLKVHGAVFL